MTSTVTWSGASPAKRAVVRQMPARVLAMPKLFGLPAEPSGLLLVSRDPTKLRAMASEYEQTHPQFRPAFLAPGEVTRLSLDPRGRANINAAPWAEVWIDGELAGDTPLANVAIRLGIREIVFKNPQFGERKVTTTIKANAPATISIDFSK